MCTEQLNCIHVIFYDKQFYFGLKRISTYRLSKATHTFHVCIVYIIAIIKWPQNRERKKSKKNLSKSNSMSSIVSQIDAGFHITGLLRQRYTEKPCDVCPGP